MGRWGRFISFSSSYGLDWNNDLTSHSLGRLLVSLWIKKQQQANLEKPIAMTNIVGLVGLVWIQTLPLECVREKLKLEHPAIRFWCGISCATLSLLNGVDWALNFQVAIWASVFAFFKVQTSKLMYPAHHVPWPKNSLLSNLCVCVYTCIHLLPTNLPPWILTLTWFWLHTGPFSPSIAALIQIRV